MNKTKLYKLIFIIAIYSAAFTLLLISIKNYTSYLSTYKSNKTTQHTKVLSSTKHIEKANCINKIQKNNAKNVLRLHVIANSDSDNDQNLKLKVRDSILHELQTGLNTATSPAQAKQYVASKFQNIKNTANYTIHQNGYSYSVKVFIQNRYFPVKTYGDLTFPAGYYDALCVEIGKAAGHNWWCVLFPSLCFENATTATVPDESKAKLKNSLTREEYDSLEKPQHTKNDGKNTADVKIRCGIYDVFTNN